MTHEPRSVLILGSAHERVRRLAGRLRLALWRAEGARVHRDVHVFGRVTLIGDPRRLAIGPGSTLNEGVPSECRSEAVLPGRVFQVNASPLPGGGAVVVLHDSTRALVPEIVPRVHRSAPIVIEDHAWVAAGAIIGAGVRIGRGAVVGAGAVVLDDVAPAMFVAGVPARVVRTLGEGELPPEVGGDEVSRRRFLRRNRGAAARER